MTPGTKNSPTFPVFLKIQGKSCVVVGGGTIAERKTADLLDAGAQITVIAKEPSHGVKRLYGDGLIELREREFRKSYIEGAFLVFAATDDSEVNIEVFKEADRLGILVNVVDNPELCNFYSGAVVKRGPMRIAVSTGGFSPSLAAGIRRELEERFPESYGDYIIEAGNWRKRILEMKDIDTDVRRTALGRIGKRDMYEIFQHHGSEGVWEELKKTIFSS